MKTINMNTNGNKTAQTIVVRERVVVEAEGKCTHGNRKPVACWKKDGSEIRKFASMKDAANALCVQPTSLSTCVKKHRLCNGYRVCLLSEMDVYMDEMMTDVNTARRLDQIILKNDLKAMEVNGKCLRNSQPLVCIETKEVFFRLADAARHFNYVPADIRNVIIGKHNHLHGMHFCYLSEYEEAARKLEKEKRKAKEKHERKIKAVEEKLQRRHEINARLETEYIRSAEMEIELERELEALKKMESELYAV